ncbi:hypothetical protein LIER_06134 [Lithospermum erythrorhizon]|uniref:Uncharacterized protein n=1 Tax=Lithospermum erythrorhizon TaxID=34254 RepID=A0AAV3P3Q6_LITER
MAVFSVLGGSTCMGMCSEPDTSAFNLLGSSASTISRISKWSIIRRRKKSNLCFLGQCSSKVFLSNQFQKPFSCLNVVALSASNSEFTGSGDDGLMSRRHFKLNGANCLVSCRCCEFMISVSEFWGWGSGNAHPMN